MNIRDYVQENYYKIRNILRNDFRKYNQLEDFNEDIFHDTLLKTIYTLGDAEVDDSIISYFMTAYKTNFVRHKEYAYYKYKEDCENILDFDSEITDMSDTLDIDFMYDAIKKHFGSEYTKYFKEWCDGYSIAEIQERYGINDLYYRFKLIKKFIKSYLLKE